MIRIQGVGVGQWRAGCLTRLFTTVYGPKRCILLGWMVSFLQLDKAPVVSPLVIIIVALETSSVFKEFSDITSLSQALRFLSTICSFLSVKYIPVNIRWVE